MFELDGGSPEGLDSLPAGALFDLSVVALEARSSATRWLALSRKPGADLAEFTRLATDLVQAAACLPSPVPARFLETLVARVRAWQTPTQERVLSTSDEASWLGLMIVLEHLSALMPREQVLEAWSAAGDGPLHLTFPKGRLVVKVCLERVGFPIHIASLDELDDAAVGSIILMALRLSGDGSPRVSLPAMIGRLRDRTAPVSSTFERRLVEVGLTRLENDRPWLELAPAEIRILPVTPQFPRLTRGMVPPQIQSVRYSVDLDAVEVPTLDDSTMLSELGVR